MAFQHVQLSISEGIADVRLNRPERLNAINAGLLDDLDAALNEALNNDEAEVILLSGAGKAFCAGNDLKDFGAGDETEETARAIVAKYQNITRWIMGSDKIVVGVVHGWAVGGGLEWALNCDITIVGLGTRFFFPETRLGLFVTGGVTSILPNLVGLQKAKELILLGEQFDATTAHELGMFSRFVADDRVAIEARNVAREIVSLPSTARRNVKTVLNRAYQLPLEEAMALETEAAVEGTLDPESKKRAAEAI